MCSHVGPCREPSQQIAGVGRFRLPFPMESSLEGVCHAYFLASAWSLATSTVRHKKTRTKTSRKYSNLKRRGWTCEWHKSSWVASSTQLIFPSDSPAPGLPKVPWYLGFMRHPARVMYQSWSLSSFLKIPKNLGSMGGSWLECHSGVTRS